MGSRFGEGLFGAGEPGFQGPQPEYNVFIDKTRCKSDTIGMHIDEWTMIVKRIDPAGQFFEGYQIHELRKEPYGEDLELGDQIIEVNGRTPVTDGKQALLDLLAAPKETTPTLDIRVRRWQERQRVSRERRDKDNTMAPGDVVILSEGEDAPGVSDERWTGRIKTLSDKAHKGYGFITCSSDLRDTIGSKEIGCPTYLINTGRFRVDDFVEFNVGFTHDGKPRAKEVTKAKKQKIPLPKIHHEMPINEHVSWTQALKSADAETAKEKMTLTAKAKGKGTLPACRQADLLSDPESEESTDSISGGVRRRWAPSVTDARYMYSRDKALEYSEDWKPLHWTEDQWMKHLQQVDELAQATSVTKGKSDLQAVKAEAQMFVDHQDTVGEPDVVANRRSPGPNLLGESCPPEVPSTKIPALQGYQKTKRQRDVLLQAAKELQINETQRAAALVSEPKRELTPFEFAELTMAEDQQLRSKVPPDLSTFGFSKQSVAKRDAITEKVTNYLLTSLPSQEVMELMDESIYWVDSLAPIAMPDLRSAELMEAKSLLESLIIAPNMCTSSSPQQGCKAVAEENERQMQLCSSLEHLGFSRRQAAAAAFRSSRTESMRQSAAAADCSATAGPPQKEIPNPSAPPQSGCFSPQGLSVQRNGNLHTAAPPPPAVPVHIQRTAPLNMTSTPRKWL